MRTISRGALAATLLLPLALTLSGCTTPGAADAPVDETTTVDGSPTAGEQVTADEPAAFAPVDASQVPEWVPADLPMPDGDYLWAAPYDLGVQLQFGLRDAGAAQALVDELLALGYVETQFTEHPSGNGATWFLEGPTIRANVVLTKTDTDEPQLSYNLERI